MNKIRLLSIVKKEFIHIKRDRASLVMAVMMPLIFIFLFGYAVNTDVSNVDMGILDFDKTTQSRELISAFENTDYFRASNYVNTVGEIEDLMNKGEIKCALIIPSGFSKDLAKNTPSKLQLVIDGSDPTTARTALQSGVLVSNAYSSKLSGLKTMFSSRIDVRTKVWYNPNLESTKFTVPGLIGLIMQNITVMLTAFALVREKEKGTLELLIVTPVKSTELILGKMIPYILIGSIDFMIALFFGTFYFGVDIKGSLLLLLILGFGFVICSLAIGMLISTVASNQAVAMQMSLLFILPSVLLSGFIFPRDAMPFAIKLIGNFVPLTYFLNILRGIILKGIGIDYLYKEVIILALLGTFLLFMACIRFKKKLD